jgi:hypothetical protein
MRAGFAEPGGHHAPNTVGRSGDESSFSIEALHLHLRRQRTVAAIE